MNENYEFERAERKFEDVKRKRARVLEESRRAHSRYGSALSDYLSISEKFKKAREKQEALWPAVANAMVETSQVWNEYKEAKAELDRLK